MYLKKGMEFKMKKIITRVLLIIGIVLAVVGIAFATYGVYKKITLNIPNPVATMEVEGYGTIKIELYPDKAPNTVANFIRLANTGFYNSTTFHRTMPNFVIQGGARNGDTTASPMLSDIMDNVEEDSAYNIPGEFIANGYDRNNVKHEKGVISMARSDYSYYGYIEEGYNSAGCQFFIMTEDNTQLDGIYAAFGKVTEGLDIVEKISNVEVYYRDTEVDEDYEIPKDEEGNEIASDTPKKQPVIKSVTVETYGVDYGVPETVKPFDISSAFASQYMGY